MCRRSSARRLLMRRRLRRQATAAVKDGTAGTWLMPAPVGGMERDWRRVVTPLLRGRREVVTAVVMGSVASSDPRANHQPLGHYQHPPAGASEAAAWLALALALASALESALASALEERPSAAARGWGRPRRHNPLGPPLGRSRLWPPPRVKLALPRGSRMAPRSSRRGHEWEREEPGIYEG